MASGLLGGVLATMTKTIAGFGVAEVFLELFAVALGDSTLRHWQENCLASAGKMRRADDVG